MNPITNRFVWMYNKNKHIIDSLVFRNAPEFVYSFDPPPLEGEIPVFTFHIALPNWFEEQCRFLFENKYRTLSAGEFYHAITSGGRCPKNSILLTFDDGIKHVWTVAFPILKKYGLKATCFILPGCISEQDQRVRPTLDDYWEGRANIKDIMSLKNKKTALATWPEIKIMHDSGVIDFQSHTMYHSLVFISEKIFDFVHPKYNTHFYGNIHIPLYSRNGRDVFSRDAQNGMPIYFAKPRMCADKRYFDNEKVRDRCINEVKSQGGEEFFKQKNWRKILLSIISDSKKKEPCSGRHETIEERDTAIFNELLSSKKIIEEKLPGKEVIHLCYPWYSAEDYAVKASQKAGFKMNYFGMYKGRKTNRPGSDPYRVVRVESLFLERLNGKGRKRIRDIFYKKNELRNTPELLGL